MIRQEYEVTVKNWVAGTAANGWKKTDLPDTKHRVLVEIDIYGIASWLGTRAVRNRNGKCKFMDGMVQVTHLKKVGP